MDTAAIETKTNKYKEMIKEMVNKKLNDRQLQEGWVWGKELQYVLGCSERTLIRWRQLYKQGSRCVGIPCIIDNGKYKYAVESIYQYYWDNAII